MNAQFIILAVLLVIGQLILPRRFAFAPLLIATFHINNEEILGNFTLHRLLILVGLIRALVGGYLNLRMSNKNTLDIFFLLFVLVAMLTASQHKDAGYNFYVSNIGLILNVCGTYFYGKSYFYQSDFFKVLAFVTTVSITPLAVMMLAEKVTKKNYHSILGVTGSGVAMRVETNTVRARGPFSHPILAGTAGAVSFALCPILWWEKRKVAVIGMASCLTIVVASSSSGPMASLMSALAFIWFWRKRMHLKLVAKLAVLGLIAVDIYMTRPIYYIIASIDLAGGSTGWHRSRLIDSAVQNFHEWWLAGTDFTRHWMPTGVSWNPNHTDITNYYLHLGVIGGFFLMLTLIGMIIQSFRILLQRQSLFESGNNQQEFVFWCLGAVLLSHATTFISVSYYDQMFVLFYLLVACISKISDFYPKVKAKK